MTTTVTKDDLAAQSTDNGQAVSDTTKYTGEFEGTFTGTLVGNATTAKELEKPYNFTLSGDATGTVAVNASSVILETTVNQATHANTADFAGKTNLAARSTLADMANTAEFAYRCGKLTKLFVNITGACVGSGSATDTDTIDINVDNINVGELFVIGSLPEEKAETSRIYVDISNRHFWVYNNDTAKWYDCFEQLETELDNHELRITDLEKLDLSNRVTSLETRADANDTTNADFEKRITKNTDDISSLDTRVTSIEVTSDVGQFSTRITTVENKVSDIETKNTEQDEKLATNTDAIAENKTAIAENKTAIAENKTACDNATTALDTRVTDIENSYVTLDTEQTITGAKTFSIITKSATPSASASGTEVVTAAWTRARLAELLPAGTIVPFAGANIPTGFLLCNGSAVSRTLYADLFSAIGTVWGTGDGSTTFNLPDARDRFLEGAGSNSLGAYLEAGLPNITGTAAWSLAYSFVYANNTALDWGQVQSSYTDVLTQTYAHVGSSKDITLNASKASSIYGNSKVVQPKALNTNYIIRY